MEGRNPADQDTVSSKELEALTGATYRQIDYWCREGIIHAIGNDTPGSGSRRRFSKSIIDKVKLVVRISNAFDRKNSPMQYIVEHYEDGQFDMGEGVYLTWDVIEIERDAR
jgi:hypothetical protein